VPDRSFVLRKLKKALDPLRYKHTLGVEKTAVALAKCHGVSAEKASLAALLHDYARQYSRQELLMLARKFKVKVDPICQFEPKLLHAELSALLAKRDFSITSPFILEAIKKHTLGSGRMSNLCKVIYLADHIEEGRSFTGVSKIRKLARKSLNAAIVEAANNMLKFLIKNKMPIHPKTIKTRNYYLIHS